ncbi:MAG: VWA domain-containing protein, partial [Gammaproteobacteria bacterium]|nr:VWA domain-containing protein [Gammaproteobacteria bacterium]
TRLIQQLKSNPDAANGLLVAQQIYLQLEPFYLQDVKAGKSNPGTPVYEPVIYRGRLDIDMLLYRFQLESLEEDINEMLDSDEEGISLTSLVDTENIDLQEIRRGDSQDKMGQFLSDIEQMIAGEEDAGPLDKIDKALAQLLESMAFKKKRGDRYYYDEWDWLIGDYRAQWCTLFEIRQMPEQPGFVSETLHHHADLARRIRKQLQLLRPEMLRKVKAMTEGEELDMEKVVEAMVDIRSGKSPGENLYVQRLRRERDVSALFLLDMSASTDDVIDKTVALDALEELSGDGGIRDPDDILDTYYATMESMRSESKGKRIIDIEKEAAVLMADALEGLGDNYAICGFTGYGREHVDYYVFKDFREKYGASARGKIGGIKPGRSTRMGPAIRHAVRSLLATESRIKTLIILSDGYPQDHDYGHDRNDRVYGLQDTTRALAEARQKGIQPFCLTVDPSGHDYLRTMCPDNQYMVIQDIDQLPHELSKVYRSLTA